MAELGGGFKMTDIRKGKGLKINNNEKKGVLNVHCFWVKNIGIGKKKLRDMFILFLGKKKKKNGIDLKKIRGYVLFLFFLGSKLK